MERSLSVLLPVQNAQCILARAVLELLEVLPELTPRFELVIIDDGSTDATIEVADDLAALYPQITVVHHVVPAGRASAIESGLAQAAGDVIFLRDDDGRLAIDEIQKLWREIDAHPLVWGRAKRNRWIGWRRRDDKSGFRMVDRKVIRDVQTALEDQVRLVTGLPHTPHTWHEVAVSTRTIHSAAQEPSLQPRRPKPDLSTRGKPAGKSPRKSEKPRRPNYLRSLKGFAVDD